MNIKYYSESDPEKMDLRDHLAYDRTVLANQRTYLAYLKFGIFSLATGLTFLKVFSDDLLYLVISYCCIALAIFAAVVGLVKFDVPRRKLNEVYKRFRGRRS